MENKKSLNKKFSKKTKNKENLQGKKNLTDALSREELSAIGNLGVQKILNPGQTLKKPRPILKNNNVKENNKPNLNEIVSNRFNTGLTTIQMEKNSFNKENLSSKNENKAKLPCNIKNSLENISGVDLSDVKVHKNSPKPGSIGALAYTRGTDIFVAPGQEKHLGHEAWHVVQQKQGRVKPTTTVKGMPVNDNIALEKEADDMGKKTNYPYTTKIETTASHDNTETSNSSNEKTVQMLNIMRIDRATCFKSGAYMHEDNESFTKMNRSRIPNGTIVEVDPEDMANDGRYIKSRVLSNGEYFNQTGYITSSYLEDDEEIEIDYLSGLICWNSAIKYLYLRGIIDRELFNNTFPATENSAKENFFNIDDEDCHQALNPDDIPAGSIVGVFKRNYTEEQDNEINLETSTLSHVMVSLGDGICIGSNNGCIGGSAAWSQVNIGQLLDWSGEGLPRTTHERDIPEKFAWGKERAVFFKTF